VPRSFRTTIQVTEQRKRPELQPPEQNFSFSRPKNPWSGGLIAAYGSQPNMDELWHWQDEAVCHQRRKTFR